MSFLLKLKFIFNQKRLIEKKKTVRSMASLINPLNNTTFLPRSWELSQQSCKLHRNTIQHKEPPPSKLSAFCGSFNFHYMEPLVVAVVVVIAQSRSGTRTPMRGWRWLGVSYRRYKLSTIDRWPAVAETESEAVVLVKLNRNKPQITHISSTQHLTARAELIPVHRHLLPLLYLVDC